ncbi:MAG TPA: hypothetical protein VLZ29_09900 [Sulfurimonas sp.]|uniref:hypothetical protein n=1 Tax=Sulfurimonas sp. TaxID=2022749 RepID=UPI002C17F0BC|nr:hypothetical protein [Sulfurimonas sp.]HUH43421.1 hypothetical protein [Sulfurimonas sp.]
MPSITETLNTYLDFEKEHHHRFNSWRHCYNHFQNEYFQGKSSDETAALHLGFYLASWGMYRGSAFLLQNDYTVHISTVQILKKYHADNVNIDYPVMKQLSDQIIEHYKKNAQKNGKTNNTASHTLITKIFLGTLGCTPAYDRYFINGLLCQNKADNTSKLVTKFNQVSIEALNNFYQENQSEFAPFAVKYPKMKLLDMYFWKVGFDRE